jgi:TnpA family transposase
VLIVRLKHRRQGRARSFRRSIFADQYAPFHTKVISVTVRDATHVLDRLLYHESDLRIEEHYTDTSGFTDHVFAL